MLGEVEVQRRCYSGGALWSEDGGRVVRRGEERRRRRREESVRG